MAQGESAMARARLPVSNHLSAEDLEAAAKAEPVGRVRARILAIRHLWRGHSLADTAGLFGLRETQVRAYLHRYNAEGLAGLRDRPHPGARPKLDAEQTARFRQRVLDGLPAALGVSAWRGATLRAWLRETFAVEYSTPGIYVLLHRLGLASLMPRPHHPEREVEA